MLGKVAAYALATAGVLYAAFSLVLFPPPSLAAGTCCNTSSDCPGSSLCYVPSGGLADCNPSYPNYCDEC